jgi:hypothetical protein
MKNEPRYEQALWRRHWIESLTTFFLYVLVQTASLKWGPPLPAGLVRDLVLISPLVPALLMLGNVVRHFQRIDEYLRVQMLENIAITTGILFAVTFTYGLLEGVGFPRLSMVTICPAMAAISIIVSIVRKVLSHQSTEIRHE